MNNPAPTVVKELKLKHVFSFVPLHSDFVYTHFNVDDDKLRKRLGNVQIFKCLKFFCNQLDVAVLHHKPLIVCCVQ